MKFHKCAALGCCTQVPLQKLMCAHHWRLVPKAVQERVVTAWRRRTLKDVATCEEHLAACCEAMKAVKEVTG